MTKRAVLYARVSGDDRDNEGRNLKGQLGLGRQYAVGKGYQVLEEIAEDDRGASGAAFELPGLNRIRELARAGGFDVLVPREIDRLSRNLAKQLIVEEELKRAGVRIEYALAEYADSAEGRLAKHIRATIAEYEREKIAERTVRGRRAKVKAGEAVTSGRVAYGLRRGAVTGSGVPRILNADERPKSGERATLLPYEPEAEVVRAVFTWYVMGDERGRPLSLRAIVQKLAGSLTYADVNGTPKGRGEGRWSLTTVTRMVKNETYAGRWHFGRYNTRTKKSNPAEHVLAVEVPAIVDRALWEAAQERMAGNRLQSKRKRKAEYLVAGRVRCGACSCAMFGKPISRGRHYRYYVCKSRFGEGDTRNCHPPYFRADQVDAAVWSWVSSVLSDPAELEVGLSNWQAEREKAGEPLRARLRIVDDLLADHRAQLGRLLDLYLRGDFPKEVLTDRKARLDGTIRALETERAGLTERLEAATLSESQIVGLHAFVAQVRRDVELASADLDTKREFLRRLRFEAELFAEDGQRKVRASFLAWSQELAIETRTICSTGHKAQQSLWLSTVLTLEECSAEGAGAQSQKARKAA